MKSKIRGVAIGKYATTVLLVFYIIILMATISGSNRAFEEVSAPLIRTLENTDLVEVNGQGFRHVYGINPADLEGVVMFTNTFSLSAEEVLLIQVSHAGQINDVVQAIEESLLARRQNFAGVAPEEVRLIDNAQLTVRGDYIFLAISPRATELRRIFLDSL